MFLLFLRPQNTFTTYCVSKNCCWQPVTELTNWRNNWSYCCHLRSQRIPTDTTGRGWCRTHARVLLPHTQFQYPREGERNRNDALPTLLCAVHTTESTAHVAPHSTTFPDFNLWVEIKWWGNAGTADFSQHDIRRESTEDPDACLGSCVGTRLYFCYSW